MSLHCKLKYVLLDLKVNQRRLSELTGFSRTTINQIANGRTEPALETALIISEALGVSIHQIWEIKKEPIR